MVLRASEHPIARQSTMAEVMSFTAQSSEVEKVTEECIEYPG